MKVTIEHGTGLAKILEPDDIEISVSEKEISEKLSDIRLFIFKQRTKILSIYNAKICNAEIIEKFFLKNGCMSRYVCMLINTENEFACVVYTWDEEIGHLPLLKIYSNVTTDQENDFNEVVLTPFTNESTILGDLY